MHELSLALNLLELVQQQAAANGLGKITQVQVQAGELTGVAPENLKFYFDHCKTETLARDAELVIEIKPLTAHCSQCQVQFLVENLNFACPACATREVKVIAGEELCLSGLTGEPLGT